jgi:membrane protein implicated in regulation of membrane protease activity
MTMMLSFPNNWIWMVVIGVVAFELMEHFGLPLFYAVKNRHKPSFCGPQGMVGKTCVVKEWEKNSGRVLFNTELWNAVGEGKLSPGRKAVIHRVQGLTLVVKPMEEET